MRTLSVSSASRKRLERLPQAALPPALTATGASKVLEGSGQKARGTHMPLPGALDVIAGSPQ